MTPLVDPVVTPASGAAVQAEQTADSTPRLLVHVLRVAALLLGAAGAAAGALSESMNSDGIAYLDIGDAYFRGELWTAVNGTWSPLYAVILGAVMKIVQPAMSVEFALVHAVNFVIFGLALLCFELFWREAARWYYDAAPGEEETPERLPRTAFTAAGYLLFIWSSTALIPVFAVTPDMLVAASVYAAAALLLRTASPTATARTWAAFGAALGVGYLAKAAMFPLAFVFLAVATVRARMSAGVARSRPVAAVAAFFLIGAPFIILLSLKEGRPTFSEVGGFTILKHVHQVPSPPYELPAAIVQGTPVHPLTRLETTPPVYAFTDPVGGTYPLAYDAAHWFEGLDAPFAARPQLRAIAENLQYYFYLFVRLQGPQLGILALLLAGVAAAGQRPLRAGGPAFLVIAAAAFGMYSLVYVTGRYIGAFVVLFWAGLLLLLRFRAGAGHRLWLNAGGAALVVAIGINIVTFHVEGLNAMVGLVPASPTGLITNSPPPPVRPALIARHLSELGVQAGDDVGVIGYSFDAFWARLLRVRIVAEVAPADLGAFWAADDAAKEAVERAFESVGVRAIVAEHVPAHAALSGWTRLGTTSYYALMLR